MKKIITILIFCLCSLSVKTQNYYMDVNNSQTITTCKGNIYPTFLCSAFGYAAYCNNENYTVTFYSGTPAIPMKISFLPLSLLGFPSSDAFFTEAGFDKLTIINGPSIGSPTLAILSGNIVAPFNFQTTSAYLTINFKSDGSNVDWGWNAIIGCQPQNCNGNLPASDVCASAVPICDLNGYCGATNGWYTPTWEVLFVEHPVQLKITHGSNSFQMPQQLILILGYKTVRQQHRVCKREFLAPRIVRRLVYLLVNPKQFMPRL